MNCPQCQCYCPPDSRECPCGYRFPDAGIPTPTAFPGQKKSLLAFIRGAASSAENSKAWTRSILLRMGFLAAMLLD
ncbi:MAG: hypothetical protein JXO51_03415 [Candidatus Aminicenantes bacterium]|nr:hypothetical protein [Candidatus Aminicenantes bacterium]